MSDLTMPERTPDPFEVERDTEDLADTFFLIDDGTARLAVCDGCGKTICTCCFYCCTWPCVCPSGMSNREWRATLARFGEGPARFGGRR